MKILELIIAKKRELESTKSDLKAEMRTARKLGFMTEFAKLEKDKDAIADFVYILDELAQEAQKERVFTEVDIQRLQSEVHSLTGDGDVMKLFNSLLGVQAS